MQAVLPRRDGRGSVWLQPPSLHALNLLDHCFAAVGHMMEMASLGSKWTGKDGLCKSHGHMTSGQGRADVGRKRTFREEAPRLGWTGKATGRQRGQSRGPREGRCDRGWRNAWYPWQQGDGRTKAGRLGDDRGLSGLPLGEGLVGQEGREGCTQTAALSPRAARLKATGSSR